MTPADVASEAARMRLSSMRPRKEAAPPMVVHMPAPMDIAKAKATEPRSSAGSVPAAAQEQHVVLMYEVLCAQQTAAHAARAASRSRSRGLLAPAPVILQTQTPPAPPVSALTGTAPPPTHCSTHTPPMPSSRTCACSTPAAAPSRWRAAKWALGPSAAFRTFSTQRFTVPS